jgi:uncharacterized protein
MEYDEEGRIGVKLLKARLRFDDYDFYMCGPAGFMQSIYDGLRDLQVADGRIHAEALGAPGLRRRQDAAALRAPARTVATDPTRVAFVRSAKEAMDAQSRDIARPGRIARRRSAVVAEAAGPAPHKDTAGAVAYDSSPAFDVFEGQALICCAKPAATAEGETLQLGI